jgi:hypothetical protein
LEGQRDVERGGREGGRRRLESRQTGEVDAWAGFRKTAREREREGLGKEENERKASLFD